MRSIIHRRLHQRFGNAQTLRTRREFLRDLLTASAGFYVTGCLGGGQKPSGEAPRVVIIGAGFAGLACAVELNSRFQVTVLEARNRLGGRVHTLRNLVPDRTVEAGASLIGLNHPTWLGYARRFGLDLIDITDEPPGLDDPIVVGGRRLSPVEAEALYESIAVFEEAVAARSAVVTDPERPWTTPGAEALDGESLGDLIDSLDLPPLSRELVEVIESSNNVAATAEQSLLGALSAVAAGGGEAYFTESEVYRCRGGNDQLVRALHDALAPDSVKTGTAVTAIHYTDTGGRVVTADGTIHEADHVVLAVPPSTWGKITFDPPLPEDFRPSMGPAIKVLAPVDTAYWEREGWSQYGVGNGAIAMTWDGTYHQAPLSENGPAALIGFSGGERALECLAVPEGEREAFFSAQLNAYFPGYPEHATAKAAFVRWPQDPWTLAGYSVPHRGEVTRIGPRLAEGFGRLRFAGEHTSWSFFGYMEGALRSGVRLARALAEGVGIDGQVAAVR